MNAGGKELLIREAVCPGDWVLLTALHRTEAGELFALAGNPMESCSETTPWHIRVVQAPDLYAGEQEEEREETLDQRFLRQIRQGLDFRYAYEAATTAPSKMTATQQKGRIKDAEAAQETQPPKAICRQWRRPSFAQNQMSGKEYGNAIHAAMQYIDYRACADEAAVKAELLRLVSQRYISQEQGAMIRPEKIAVFFATELGEKLRRGQVEREFKFSILEDGAAYDPRLSGESVLLQGVVDCALIEEDGITVIDFKTDYVTEETLPHALARYRSQVKAYAMAMERIYQKKVKQALLYFFHMDRFAEVDV
jgi:ATP-dependent helicase/nuclease subunit A